MRKPRLDAGRRRIAALAVFRASVFLLTLAMTWQPASAEGTADPGAPPLPPQELGSDWRKVNELDLPDDGIRLRLREGQWVMASPDGWVTNRHCKELASALVFDPQLGLILVAHRNFEKPVVREWEVEFMKVGPKSIVEIPLRRSVRNGSAVAGAPRFPLKEYVWRTAPMFDEQRRMARWGFAARTDDVTWAAYSWLLFDGDGYTSILLLSRPGNGDTVWPDLDVRSDPPIIIQSLANRPPLETYPDGPDSYGTDFLTMLQLLDAVGCSLRADFGPAY